MSRLKWVVEFKVHESWAEDGFNPDDEGFRDMLASALPYALNFELHAKILKRPSQKKIAKLQGYSSVKEMNKSL